jgi:diguanylate cyclase (GGDEF)-like protein
VTIDTQTMLLIQGAVVAVCSIAFMLHVLGRNNRTARTWTIAYISGILSGLAHAIWGFTADSWWAVGIANAAFVLTMAALWVGCRQFNNRPSLLWVALTATGVTAVAALLEGPAGGDWAGAEVTFVMLAAFAALSGIETLRGLLRRNYSGRVLPVVFFGTALFYGVRTVIFIVDGPDGDIFQNYVGTPVAAFVTIVLVILATISMTVLTAGATSVASATRAHETQSDLPGVLGMADFEQHARNWLVRARRERDDLALVTMDVANLEHMNTAFGRDYGDDAIRAVARISLEYLPSAALVGYGHGKRFTILTTAPGVGDASIVAERVHTALVETPIDPVEGIRAVATCGLSTTRESGYDYAALRASSLRAVAEANQVGAGTIRRAEGTVPAATP